MMGSPHRFCVYVYVSLLHVQYDQYMFVCGSLYKLIYVCTIAPDSFICQCCFYANKCPSQNRIYLDIYSDTAVDRRENIGGRSETDTGEFGLCVAENYIVTCACHGIESMICIITT